MDCREMHVFTQLNTAAKIKSHIQTHKYIYSIRVRKTEHEHKDKLTLQTTKKSMKNMNQPHKKATHGFTEES